MNVSIILICEDPSYGLRGHRKFWSATYEGSNNIFTEWGRIRDGRELNVERLAKGSSQSTYVFVKTPEEAVKFLDKKISEKAKKGYKVVKHVVDGLNLGLFSAGAASPRGIVQMQTLNGTSRRY